MGTPERIINCADFCDFYIREHSKPLTRLLHFVGTSLGIIFACLVCMDGPLVFLPGFFVVGYAFGWLCRGEQFLVERCKISGRSTGSAGG